MRNDINEMLKEKTGTHFLDSGGAYGRHWEKNQGRDFEKEDACIIDVQANEDGTIKGLYIMFNLYHFLKAHTDTDEVTEFLQKKFDEFAGRDENSDDTWEDTQNKFCKEYNIDAKHSYYTYNFENILSQDIIVVECEDEEGEDFIFLRIHQGCDARGGFGSPKIFRKSEYFEIAMNEISIGCIGGSERMTAGVDGLFDMPATYCQNNWTSDDGGYNWYYDGSTADGKDLFDTIRYEEETKKFYCRDCGGEVYISITESY